MTSPARILVVEHHPEQETIVGFGWGRSALADRLAVSVGTIDDDRSNICATLDLEDPAALARHAAVWAGRS